MKVVYHPRYREVYAGDPAAAAGRLESSLKEVSSRFELVTPQPASVEDILLVHHGLHIQRIERDPLLYEIALLSAGGAIEAAELAVSGEPAFGLIRPPGHHASPDHCWGFCYFNNVAISIARLRAEGKINTALILDFDLHFGDGTDNFFAGVPEVTYFHPEHMNSKGFIGGITDFLAERDTDIIAVSAGFDRHEEDWGGQLTTDDYRDIGKLVRDFSERACQGRRYGVLEGGYNHDVLGKNVLAFIEGLE